MKKIISLMLCLAMLLSVSAFALPVLDVAEKAEISETGTKANLSSETVTVYFTGDISTKFAPINANAGDIIDLSDYLDVELNALAKADHKRFNGWMPDGVEKNLTTSTVTVSDDDGDGKMELVALVNHDFNFALEANRNMWYGNRGAFSTTDKTIAIESVKGTSGHSTYASLQVADEYNGADFEIDTDMYIGTVIYMGYNTKASGDGISNISQATWLYGIGFTDKGRQSATKWTSEPEICPPRALPNWGNSNFYKDFDLIKDENGSVLYAGVPVTTKTSTTARKANYSCLEEQWKNKNVNSMAVLFRGRCPESFEVRYVRFVSSENNYAKPGINIWTGTEEPYTFEGTSSADYYTYGGAALVTGDGNTYMEYSGTTSHFTIKKTVPIIDKNRKVKVNFKAEADTAATKSVFIVRNTLNNFKPELGLIYSSIPASWTTFSKDVMSADVAVTGNSSVFTDNTCDIRQLILISQSNNSSNKLRIDDVSVIPYYRVVYDANGGINVPEMTWWLPSASGVKYTVSSEAPMRAGYKFAGWSVDGVTAVTEVTPANKDIVLVALWEEDPNQQAVEYDFASDVPGVADGTISLIAPSASYTTATINFADENGKLEGYTSFGTAALTQGFGSYTVTGNRAFAAGATALEVAFSGEGAENVTKTFTIPEEHRMPESTPLYTYYVVSDTHLGGNSEHIDYFYGQWQNPTGNMRTYALGNANSKGDVFSNGADFVVVNGDLVNPGSYITDEGTDVGEERYWNVLDRYIDERLNIHGVPVFLTNGNHEFYQNDRMNTTGAFSPDRLISSITGQVDYIEENYGKKVEIIRDAENEDALYYAANMYGTKYIFMSTPEMSEDKMTGSYAVSDKQLAFVEAQLAEASGNTVFVMTHMPLSGITNKDAVSALLAKYPNAIVFNSHTHVDLSADKHNTVVGDMVSGFTTCDTGSTISISNPYSTGQYVEVYLDKVVIKARKFAEESEIYGNALYFIDTPDENAFDEANPETVETQEMRITQENGKLVSAIRFKGVVTAKQRNASSEYGIITTRKTFLEAMGENAELTFDFYYGDKPLYAYGAAYALDEEGNVVADKVAGIDGETGDVTFAAALTGIDSTNAAQVNEVFVARSYIKYTNGDKTFTFYGNTEENSLVGVARKVDTSVLPDDYKTEVEDIVKLEK